MDDNGRQWTTMAARMRRDVTFQDDVVVEVGGNGGGDGDHGAENNELHHRRRLHGDHELYTPVSSAERNLIIQRPGSLYYLGSHIWVHSAFNR